MLRELRTAKTRNLRQVLPKYELGHHTDIVSQHNDHYGDEKLMETLFKMGRMGEKKNGTPGLTREEIAKEAAKM